MTENVLTQTFNVNPSMNISIASLIPTIKYKVLHNHGRLINEKVVIFTKGDIIDVLSDEETKDYIKRGYLDELKDITFQV